MFVFKKIRHEYNHLFYKLITSFIIELSNHIIPKLFNIIFNGRESALIKNKTQALVF